MVGQLEVAINGGFCQVDRIPTYIIIKNNKRIVDMIKNKKQYFITELHMGDDGLEDYSDHSGPYTLPKARRILERMFKFPGAFINPYAFAIRGPRHTNDHGHNTEFYSTREDR